MMTAIERYPILAQFVMLLIVISSGVLGGLASILYEKHKKKGAP